MLRNDSYHWICSDHVQKGEHAMNEGPVSQLKRL